MFVWRSDFQTFCQRPKFKARGLTLIRWRLLKRISIGPRIVYQDHWFTKIIEVVRLCRYHVLNLKDTFQVVLCLPHDAKNFIPRPKTGWRYEFQNHRLVRSQWTQLVVTEARAWETVLPCLTETPNTDLILIRACRAIWIFGPPNARMIEIIVTYKMTE